MFNTKLENIELRFGLFNIIYHTGYWHVDSIWQKYIVIDNVKKENV